MSVLQPVKYTDNVKTMVDKFNTIIQSIADGDVGATDDIEIELLRESISGLETTIETVNSTLVEHKTSMDGIDEKLQSVESSVDTVSIEVGDLSEQFASKVTGFEEFKESTISNLEELEEANTLSTVKSSKDSEGIFQVITYNRPDGTVFATSILSGGSSPQYSTRTLTFYENDGITVKDTKVFALSYDSDGDLVSEV